MSTNQADRDPRYNAQTLRRFRTTPGSTPLPSGMSCVTGRAGDREHGAEVLILLAIADERVAAASFRAFGCPHLIAAASLATEQLVGCSAADLLVWDWHPVAVELEVPAAKSGRLLTLQDAVVDAARNWAGGPRSEV
jgi:NifU-like protein involved in Fe-S cluster formation